MLNSISGLVGMQPSQLLSESILLGFVGIDRKLHSAMTDIVGTFVVCTGRLGWMKW